MYRPEESYEGSEEPLGQEPTSSQPVLPCSCIVGCPSEIPHPQALRPACPKLIHPARALDGALNPQSCFRTPSSSLDSARIASKRVLNMPSVLPDSPVIHSRIRQVRSVLVFSESSLISWWLLHWRKTHSQREPTLVAPWRSPSNALSAANRSSTRLSGRRPNASVHLRTDGRENCHPSRTKATIRHPGWSLRSCGCLLDRILWSS